VNGFILKASNPLMKPLAIPLYRQETVARRLVMMKPLIGLLAI